MAEKYQTVEMTKSGWSKWEIWPRKVRHGCCGCSLVHDLEMMVDKRGKIVMRWRINNRATAAMRRGKK
jgi:hypothetical protein